MTAPPPPGSNPDPTPFTADDYAARRARAAHAAGEAGAPRPPGPTPAPTPSPADDSAARRARAAHAAGEAGLSGLLVMPGPDLAYLTGYSPTAITERLTVLIIPAESDPTMVVPILERPDA